MSKIFHSEKITKVLDGLGTKILEKIEQRKDSFLSYHFRPQRAAAVQISSRPSPSDRLGIAMQGPLVIEKDFTLESVLTLRKVFPQARLLLSAWKTEDPQYLRRFQENGVEVIVNTPPQNPGPSHINKSLHPIVTSF
jgi:hypothetical protein